jgi:hypothetical protein
MSSTGLPLQHLYYMLWSSLGFNYLRWDVRFCLLISQQTDKISQQPENWENRNDPDLVQAFPKKWWVESNLTALNLPLPLRLKGFGCHYNSIQSLF